MRRPNLTLAGSAILYVVARWFDWNLASYPPGTTWYFNPFAWQLMFVFGAWCGVGGAAKLKFIIQSRVALALGDCVDSLCVPDRHDPARRIPGEFGAKMDDQGDLSDRQERSRYAALHPLPRRGARRHALSPAPLGAAHLEMAASADPVRSAFAADFLFFGLPVLLGRIGS
jgi:hypothetical protein